LSGKLTPQIQAQRKSMPTSPRARVSHMESRAKKGTHAKNVVKIIQQRSDSFMQIRVLCRWRREVHTAERVQTRMDRTDLQTFIHSDGHKNQSTEQIA
jgi:hypothetical protein